MKEKEEKMRNTLLRRQIKSAFSHWILCFLILSAVLFCAYFFCDLFGCYPDLPKLKSYFFLHGMRNLFRLLGWECLGPLILMIGVLSGGYTCHMMDPAGGQPAANPAAEQASDGASTSGWRSFDEGVLLESMPSSNESSEASVNQQPFIPELEPPLLDDNTRRAELAARLRAHWWGISYTEPILDSFVRSQLAVERHIEAALVADGYPAAVIMERRHLIRGFLFYPEGRALSENAYSGHLRQILNLGTRQSVPYRRIIRAVHNSHLFLY